MGDYVGYLVRGDDDGVFQKSHTPPSSLALAADFEYASPGEGTDDWVDETILVSGALSGATPEAATESGTFTGYVIPSFFDDLYGHFHIWVEGNSFEHQPQTVDWGFLSFPLPETTVHIWNAYNSVHSMQSVTFSGAGASNISTDADDALPEPFQPEQERTFTFEPSSASEVISARATLGLSDSTDPYFLFSAIGLIVFGHFQKADVEVPINWGWNIGIMRNRTGGEVRTLFGYSRARTMELRFMLRTYQETQDVIQKLRASKGQIGVPMWPYYRQLTAPASIGATTINVNTTNSRFANGALILIMKEWNVTDVARVNSVNVGSLALVASIASNYATGDYVIPLLTGWLDNQTIMHYTINADIAELTMRVKELPE